MAEETNEAAPAKAGKVELTKDGSHVAIAKGYANGVIIEEGEPVPEGIPVALNTDHEFGWMKVAKKAKSED